jgi:lysophospholipid acyltransferase (LPLAT)-like uncharacterized protein
MRNSKPSDDNPASPAPPSTNRVKELRGWRAALVWLLAAALRLWTATLRIQPDEATQELLKSLPKSATVVVLWHNRLFASPRFYRRYISGRQPAALISASGDGAWLAALLRNLGIEPVRGSRHRRGAQALKELKMRYHEGCDLVITPDGSRGPRYQMKPGAAHLALGSDAAVVLFALLSKHHFCLPTWDRFQIPFPFSKVEVRMRLVSDLRAISAGDVEQARAYLEQALRELSECPQ